MRRVARFLIRTGTFGLLRVSRFVEGVSRALAFTTFTSGELDALAVPEWEDFGERGPIVGNELFGWEQELFASHVRPSDSILVAGAGSGRDVLPFLEAGHQVTALDIAPGALATLKDRARRRGRSVATIHASVVDADLPAASFDVILFSWFTFGYIRGSTARQAALLRSEKALRPGGRMVVSYPCRVEAGGRRPFVAKLARVVARTIGGVEVEPGDEFNVTGTASRPSVFFTHHFTDREIEGEVQQAGLHILEHTRPAPGVGVLILVRSSQIRQ